MCLFVASFVAWVQLLLIVNCDRRYLLALCIRGGGRNCTRLPVARDNYATGKRYLSVFLADYVQRVLVNFLVRSHVGVGIARYRIFLSVILSCPLAMCGIAVLINSVNGNLHLISCGFVNDRVVPRLARELRFGFVNF